MSDNFLKIARKEIQEELDGIQKILSECKNDSDISTNGKNIEKHFHKIKGLAPMMEQNDVGEIAKIMDVILKHVIENGSVVGTYEMLSEANQVMKEIFNATYTKDADEFKKKIQNTFSNLLK